MLTKRSEILEDTLVPDIVSYLGMNTFDSEILSKKKESWEADDDDVDEDEFDDDFDDDDFDDDDFDDEDWEDDFDDEEDDVENYN